MNRRERPSAADRAGGAQAQTSGLEYPLPEATVRAWQAHKDRAPQNPGLVFDRFAPDWSRESKGQRDPWKKQGLNQVVLAAKRVDSGLLTAWNKRWQEAAKALSADQFSLRTDWRFITGLGSHGPLEVGFTFHRYGFPVLPGSSVKGLARMAGLVAVAEKLAADDIGKLDAVLSLGDKAKFDKCFAAEYPEANSEASNLAGDFRAIFGTTAAAGGAIFFDAIPASQPQLELDIMNPHYPDYYRDVQAGKQKVAPPANWQSPIPLYFLTVAPGTEFRFAVGWRARDEGDWQRLRSLAKDWLKTGLLEIGAGAKTSAGYGYFLPRPGAGEPDLTRSGEAQQATAASEEAPAAAATPPPTTPVERRRGIVVEINPSRRRGRLRDKETGQEHAFTMQELEGGKTPAKREEVEYHLQGARVTLVRRLR